MGQMAAPHLLVLADLIAPFIPIGLCGSLSVIAGGLSLLFPTCWRKPLPNTLDEAENKVLIPVKDRYPSFRDLKNGKFCSLGGITSSANNVYTIPPTYPKTDIKYDDHIQNDSINGMTVYSLNPDGNGIRPSGVYNEDNDSRLSDLEDEIENGNWRLYSSQMQGHELKDRDVQHVFSKAATRAPDTMKISYAKSGHVHVAETNL